MSENQIEIINQREVELLERNRKVNLQKLFTPEGMDLIISEIEKEVADFSGDITTKKGQAEIKSMAAKIAKCKSPIKNLAMELKDESRKLIDSVNAQWNRYEEAMDNLRDEIRRPVDEIEEKEAAELKGRQDRLAQIEQLRFVDSVKSEDIQKKLEELKELKIFEWGDFLFKAVSIGEEIFGTLITKLCAAKKYEAEQAELAQLKKEKAERDQKDHEEKIAREAAEKAKRDAEEFAEKQRQKIEEEKRAAEQAQINAELRAKEAERLAAEQAAQSELARIEAEKKAKEDAEKAASEAVEKERERIRQEGELVRREAEKREANKKHRAKTEKEAKNALNNSILHTVQQYWGSPLGEDQKEIISEAAEIIVEAIAKGEVPHISINY